MKRSVRAGAMNAPNFLSIALEAGISEEHTVVAVTAFADTPPPSTEALEGRG